MMHPSLPSFLACLSFFVGREGPYRVFAPLRRNLVSIYSSGLRKLIHLPDRRGPTGLAVTGSTLLELIGFR
jgi:hypothetical protein